MDILIGIVIATFIIAAVYVGYYVSQTPQIEEAGLHGTHLESLTIPIKPLQSNTDESIKIFSYNFIFLH